MSVHPRFFVPFAKHDMVHRCLVAMSCTDDLLGPLLTLRDRRQLRRWRSFDQDLSKPAPVDASHAAGKLTAALGRPVGLCEAKVALQQIGERVTPEGSNGAWT